MQAASGTYTGNGVDDRDITISTGFGTPDFVLVKRLTGVFDEFRPYIRTSSMVGDTAKVLGAASANAANYIQTFGADIFQVGTESATNADTYTYGYLACRDDGGGDFAVFTYTGDGTDSRNVGAFTFTAALAFVLPDSAALAYWRHDELASDQAQDFEGVIASDRIQAFNAGSIQVGTSLNANGVTYHVAVWATSAVATIEYTGDDTNNRLISHGLSGTPIFAFGQEQDVPDPEAYWAYQDSSALMHCALNSLNEAISRIDAFLATTIRVDAGANALGTTYSLIAWPGSSSGAVSLAVTGTITPSATEQEVRDGGKTIILTLTGGTWDSTMGACNEVTERLIDNLVSDQNEDLGWNNIVRGGISYEDSVLADSPQAYWRLADTTDSSGAGLSINTVGSGVTQDVDGLLTRSYNEAMAFDGINAGCTITDVAALRNIFDGGGAAEAIIRPLSDGESDNGRIVSKGNIWALFVSNQSGGLVKLNFRQEFSTTTGLWQTTSAVLPLGGRVHIVVVYDSSSTANDPTFYINGHAYTTANGRLTETSTPAGTYSSDTGEDVYIGGFGADVLRFRGVIDEVALYGSTLSQARVLAHLHSASNPFGLTCDDIVRTSNTVVTITMPAFPIYDITVDETITVTAPAETHSGSNDITGSPTFDIITDGVRTIPYNPPSDSGPNPGGGGDPNNPGSGGTEPPPFEGDNGGLGPPAPGVEDDDDPDSWQFGLDTLDVGLGGVNNQRRGRLLRIEVAEIAPTE